MLLKAQNPSPSWGANGEPELASGSRVNRGQDADLRNRSVQGLISSLRCAFRDSEFVMAERVLVAREEELKREIETGWKGNERIPEIKAFSVSREQKLMQEIARVKENHDLQRLEKIAFEAELKKCRREILDLIGQNLWLTAETKRLMNDINVNVSLQMNCSTRG